MAEKSCGNSRRSGAVAVLTFCDSFFVSRSVVPGLEGHRSSRIQQVRGAWRADLSGKFTHTAAGILQQEISVFAAHLIWSLECTNPVQAKSGAYTLVLDTSVIIRHTIWRPVRSVSMSAVSTMILEDLWLLWRWVSFEVWLDQCKHLEASLNKAQGSISEEQFWPVLQRRAVCTYWTAAIDCAKLSCHNGQQFSCTYSCGIKSWSNLSHVRTQMTIEGVGRFGMESFLLNVALI